MAASPTPMPTPRDTLFREGTARLYRFRAASGAPRAGAAAPLLLVPSLINRWYVLDLREGASMAGALVGAGIDTFCLDWGVPEDEDRYLDWGGRARAARAGRARGAALPRARRRCRSSATAWAARSRRSTRRSIRSRSPRWSTWRGRSTSRTAACCAPSSTSGGSTRAPSPAAGQRHAFADAKRLCCAAARRSRSRSGSASSIAASTRRRARRSTRSRRGRATTCRSPAPRTRRTSRTSTRGTSS